MTSPIIVQRTLSSGLITTFGLDALTDVYDNTVSGDRVFYEGGDIDLGASGVQIKTGVKWKFLGFPTVASDSALGTFYDNNSAVTVHFDGDVNITNSNGLASRIILDHASSVINGFWWEYDAELLQSSTSAPTALINKNTLGDVPVLTRDSLGVYVATLSEAFSAQASVLMTYYDATQGGVVRNLVVFEKAANTITIACYDNAETAALVDLGGRMTINIKVYP